MSKDWKVTFEFDGPEGERIPIEKTFPWGDYTVYVPAVHLFPEGLVLDICLEVNRERVTAFLDKWKDVLGRKPTRQEEREIRGENPMMHRYSRKLWVNGVELKRSSGCGNSYIPPEMLTEAYRRQAEAAFMNGLGLDREKVWTHMQMKYFWEGEPASRIDSMEMTLMQDPYECYGNCFEMPAIGESVELTHPRTGENYILTVTDIQRETVKLPPQPGVIFPDNVLIMSYQMEPDLPRQRFYLTDVAEDDKPRKENGETMGQSRAWGLLLRNPDHYTVSSAHFEPVEYVTWQAVFLEKDLEDVTVTLI